MVLRGDDPALVEVRGNAVDRLPANASCQALRISWPDDPPDRLTDDRCGLVIDDQDPTLSLRVGGGHVAIRRGAPAPAPLPPEEQMSAPHPLPGGDGLPLCADRPHLGP